METVKKPELHPPRGVLRILVVALNEEHSRANSKHGQPTNQALPTLGGVREC